MGVNSKIEWTNNTFNPWIGCTGVSPGCANCYAKRDWDDRRHFAHWGADQNAGATRIVTSEANWRQPEKWNKHAALTADLWAALQRSDRDDLKRNATYDGPPRVFCASLCDVYEDWKGYMLTRDGKPYWWCGGSLSNSSINVNRLPRDFRYATMQDFRRRLWQIIDDTPALTWLVLTKRPENVIAFSPLHWIPDHYGAKYPANFCIGTSIETNRQAKRADQLRLIPAATRFLSCEPLLGPLDQLDLAGIHWVIAGGESGPKARPTHPAWVRGLLDKCQAANIPFFFKQWGEWYPTFADAGSPGGRVTDNFTFPDGQLMWRIGKQNAGRTFLGCEWSELPPHFSANHFSVERSL